MNIIYLTPTNGILYRLLFHSLVNLIIDRNLDNLKKDDSKEIYFRLLTKPAKYTRLNKVKWKNIKDLNASAHLLASLNIPLISLDGPETVSLILDFLTKPELAKDLKSNGVAFSNTSKVPLYSSVLYFTIRFQS